MIQEMKLEDALKKFLQGEEVLVMHNETSKPEKPAYTIKSIKETLDGMHFLVDLPEPKSIKQIEEKEPRGIAEKAIKHPTPRGSVLDEYAEEIKEMLREKKSQRAIADRFHVNQGTVCNWINTRKKCRSCQYRSANSKTGNCDYIGKTGHKRDCISVDCEKYIKGDPLPILKGISLCD